LLAREEGKTLPEGIGEVARAGQIFSFFAGEALRLTGEKGASVRPGLDVEITREAVGVIGLITPWNFPIAIPAWKIAPALRYGNSVVFKPAEIVPGSAHALSEIIARSGIPAGVFNLVMGSGSVVGQTMIEHPDVAALSRPLRRPQGIELRRPRTRRLTTQLPKRAFIAKHLNIGSGAARPATPDTTSSGKALNGDFTNTAHQRSTRPTIAFAQSCGKLQWVLSPRPMRTETLL